MPLQKREREGGRETGPTDPRPSSRRGGTTVWLPPSDLKSWQLAAAKERHRQHATATATAMATKATFAYYDVCIMKQFISHFLFLGQNAAYEEVFVCLSGSFLAFLIDFKAAIRPAGLAKCIAKYLRVSHLN